VTIPSEVLCNAITHSLSNNLFCAFTGIIQRNSRYIPLALGPTNPSVQLVPGAISSRVKWPKGEANQSPIPSAEQRMEGAMLRLRLFVFMACT
jgi:hypothetical protein